MDSEILVLDKNYQPHRWIDIEEAIILESKKLIIDHKGEAIIKYNGGMNRLTNLRSFIETSSIIVIDGAPINNKFKEPALTNSSLFQRDRLMCAYCSRVYRTHNLTCDHIKPTSKGGKNIWMNVVTACRSCNFLKGDIEPGHKLPKGVYGPFGDKMELVYVPYIPSKAEYMIMKNRNIKADQMEFLITQIPNKDVSRIYKDYK